MKKIGGVFAFKVKDGPGGQEATWVVDVKNGKGCVDMNSGKYLHSGVFNIGGFFCIKSSAVVWKFKSDVISSSLNL